MHSIAVNPDDICTENLLSGFLNFEFTSVLHAIPVLIKFTGCVAEPLTKLIVNVSETYKSRVTIQILLQILKMAKNLKY